MRARPARLGFLTAGLGASLLALHLIAKNAVASAIAFAPNASRSPSSTAELAMPTALVSRGAHSLSVRVGPPAATIVSWVVPPRELPSKATVVLLHGIRMNKRSLAPIALALSDAGYRTVLVDLRGHGESSGRYLTYGAVESEDLGAILDALGEKRTACSGVYGFSYGAAVAIELSARDGRIGAVVSVAPFSSLREVTTDYERKYLPAPLRLVPDAWFQSAVDEAGERAQFDPDGASPLRSAARSNTPLLLVHGTRDDQVPLRHSVAIARVAGGRAELVELPGAAHGDMPIDSSGAVRRRAVSWFDRWLARSECAGLP
jgi:dipeptidyl aminopeptidase/acylaminoacyl peptidase